MGEAAVKEPSMEDILSSIRKIIAEEGDGEDATPNTAADEVAAPVAAEVEAVADAAPVVEQVDPVVETPVVDTQAESPTEDASPSGSDAAKMAGSLAALAQSIQAEKEVEAPAGQEIAQPAGDEAASDTVESIWNSVEEPEATPYESGPALENEPVEAPAAEKAPEPAAVEPEITETVEIESQMETVAAATEVRHIEMADATPAPSASDETEAFRGALMSPGTDGAVSGAFDRLKRSAMDDIDAKTEAILRPMLREWLDENLPSMVERLVREEIERVARGV